MEDYLNRLIHLSADATYSVLSRSPEFHEPVDCLHHDTWNTINWFMILLSWILPPRHRSLVWQRVPFDNVLLFSFWSVQPKPDVCDLGVSYMTSGLNTDYLKQERACLHSHRDVRTRHRTIWPLKKKKEKNRTWNDGHVTRWVNTIVVTQWKWCNGVRTAANVRQLMCSLL